MRGRIVLVCLLVAGATLARGQGALAPSGPPAPGMKTLDQIEPRIPLGGPDFPYVITDSGSFYLTESVQIGTAGLPLIQIMTGDVTIDLMGYRLEGVDGIGILYSGPAGGGNIVVRNGTIYNTLAAIDLSGASNCRVESVRVDGCTSGIQVGPGSIVSDCQVTRCTSGGATVYSIRAGDHSIIRDCVARANTAAAGSLRVIAAGDSSVVENCIASENIGGSLLAGIEVGDASTIRSCTAYGNSAPGDVYGIRSGANGVIESCASSSNGGDGASGGGANDECFGIYGGAGSNIVNCAASNNGGSAGDAAAIGAGTSVTVRGCNLRGNGRDGILAGDDCRIEGNAVSDTATILGNGSGIVLRGSGAFASDNVLDGNFIGISVTGAGNSISGNRARGSISRNLDLGADGNYEILLCELPDEIQRSARVTLAGSLSLPTLNTNGIEVTADDVTIDLGGHSLIGPGAAGGMDGSGIFAPNVANLAVLNGTIRNWRISGIEASPGATGAQFRSLRLRGNGQDGATALSNSTVNDCLAEANGGTGIAVGNQSVLTNCLAADNGSGGLSTGEASIVSGCSARNNGGNGIAVGEGSTVSRSSAQGNGLHGFHGNGVVSMFECTSLSNDSNGFLINRGTAVHCVAQNNSALGIYMNGGPGAIRACSAANNDSGGIQVENDVYVADNYMQGNGSWSLDSTGVGNTYIDNVVAEATDGIRVFNVGNIIVRNFVLGYSGTPYSLPGVNIEGPEVNVLAAPIASEHPWANFHR